MIESLLDWHRFQRYATLPLLQVCQFRCLQFVKLSGETGFSISTTKPVGATTFSVSEVRPTPVPITVSQPGPPRQLPPLRVAHHRNTIPVYGETLTHEFSAKTA
ncbi:hypothetical protein AB6A40_002623 [Gnathostoma spinigerum]|uniref:Uncharacterized protein n=1 Tax=Gnathostoma spinigerum TaxID=75299 RepID=A0ABD6E738_9BILA